MGGYVDIHAHILPDIDDGPSDLAQALAMARSAVDSGIATIVAAPHLRPDFPRVHVSELAERCQDLQAAIDNAGIPLRVVPGAEASLAWALEASDRDLALASYGQRRTDILVETPSTAAAGIGAALYELRAKGYRITLAHPERCLGFQEDDGAVRELVAQGVLLQLNAESLLGVEGSRQRRFSRTLVTEGLVHALASDGHRGNRWRPVTRLAEGFAEAARLVGHDRALWMTHAAPAAIVEGASLSEAPPIVRRGSRRRLFGLRGRLLDGISAARRNPPAD
jgi:protein-tyrosine phosphatase